MRRRPPGPPAPWPTPPCGPGGPATGANGRRTDRQIDGRMDGVCREFRGNEAGENMKNKLIKNLHISIKSPRDQTPCCCNGSHYYCCLFSSSSSSPLSSSSPSSFFSSSMFGLRELLLILQRGGTRLPPGLRGQLPYF